MSIIKKIKADLSESWVFVYIKIKYKLLITPIKITRLDKIKSNLKFR